MSLGRRTLFQLLGGSGLASLLPKKTAGADGDYLPVDTPHLETLAFIREGSVKVFDLVAEPVKRTLVPGKVADVWGFNGSMPGPTIEVREGDRVRIRFTNRLPEPTTMHWHGLEVPIEMDGVPAISQPLVHPGQSFDYEFTLRQHGTFFYHSHMPMQHMMGLIGFFIVHPKAAYLPAVQKDFGLILQEFQILPNSTIPNTMAMEFNWLTMNGKAGPAVRPLVVKLGERVRLRFVNMGMDHHPMHLHGFQFAITGTEGGRIPEPLWYPLNTVLVGVAQARTVEFEAKYPGDWMLHCHLPHHMMNQMVSMVGPMSHWPHALTTRATGAGPGEPSVDAHAGHGTSAEAKRVPGFPQDMWMTMDDAVASPETHAMAPGWTGAMMGMMTVVRVLKPDLYAQVTSLAREARSKAAPGG
jgi:FtsP/CotA-like multicopper oxidase with cupredoxin domain